MKHGDINIDMTLYLVRGTVERGEYMGGKPYVFDDLKLVYAASEREAEQKFERHWEAQTEPYANAYFVRRVEAKAPLA